MRHNRRPTRRPPRRSPTVLTCLNPDVAGIDCGAAEHDVAVPPDRDPDPVQHFSTFTDGLQRLADWLTACRVNSVAMEATGVYGIPVSELLEARGFTVLLVNARHLKNVPGRKTDVTDAEWIRDLHSVGLLRGSFRPTAGITALRAYLRHRQTLVESAAIYTQRMQKALVQMNLLLTQVVSDITGVTGLRILRDSVAGQRDPQQLAAHRDYRCHASQADIVAALTGQYRPEHLFVLQQNLDLFDACQRQLAACDDAIAAHLATLTAYVPPPAPPIAAPRVRRQARDNSPTFEMREPLHHLTGGVDLSQIDGIAPYTALKLLSELGTDMSRWPTEKHLTAWLTLAPNNRISGGRLLSSRTRPSANRAAAILRFAVMSLSHTHTALGAFYRRLAARIGKPQAVTATARKLAILVYRALKGELQYRDPGADAYDRQQRSRVLRRLRQRAAALGFELVDRQTGEVQSIATS
ncbi:MAG: IS110 family transposase [Acidobacteriota bacterium]